MLMSKLSLVDMTAPQKKRPARKYRNHLNWGDELNLAIAQPSSEKTNEATTEADNSFWDNIFEVQGNDASKDTSKKKKNKKQKKKKKAKSSSKSKSNSTAEYRFMNRILRKKKFSTFNNAFLFTWNTVHWEKMDRNFLKKEAIQFLGDQVTYAKASSSANTAMTALPEIPERTNQIVIPCRDNYLLIKNGKLIKISPDKNMGFTYCIDATVTNSKPQGKLFKAFLDSSLPDTEIQQLLQEYAGYTLLPDTRFHRAALFTGPGGNGKSAFIKILRALHPMNASIKLDQLDGFLSSELIGASLITNDEVPQGPIHDESIKALISGDPFQLNQKNKEIISFSNKAKLIANCNNIPAIKDSTEGFWRRFIIVPWTYKVPEEKKNPLLAEDIIASELDYVLRWAIEGLLRLLKNNGRFNVPATVEKEKRQAQLDTNSVLNWIEDSDVYNTNEHPLLKKEVYSDYRTWAQENGLKGVGSPEFWKRVKQVLPYQESQVTRCGRRQRSVNINFRGRETVF